LGAVATETARWVAQLEGTQCRLFDTRKTTPGWRYLEKYAVRCGGGHNNRLGLWDAVMVKDNHLVRAGRPRAGALTALMEKIIARSAVPVIVEVEDLDACRDVARSGVGVILLDNMSLAEIADCVNTVHELNLAKRPEIEVSGGVTFDKLKDLAATGVDRISTGALTQSPPRLDLGLDWLT
jgi:nicotinate-nucleotide pyrophosphorylase (carboxylating)